MEQRDVVIIGGGPAGYAAAIRISQLGGKPTLIESDTLGGTCLSRGCIPTRALARTAELLDTGRNARDYGITYRDLAVDFTKMMARKDMVVTTLVGGVKHLLKGNKVEVIEGTARLAAPTEIEVAPRDGTRQTYKARKVIVATGSTCGPGMVKGAGPRVITTTGALTLKEAPRSLIVVGSGFVGITLATIFAVLGASVSVIEESHAILPQIDREIVAIMERELKGNRIHVHTGTTIVAAKETDHGITVTVEREGKTSLMTADFLLMAEAREANTKDLNLFGIGIAGNPLGGILVNRKMETNVLSVYAAGDVTMEHMWTPVAYVEGITAADNAMGLNREVDYGAIPYWISSVPEIASVGLTEEEAHAQGHGIEVGRFPFSANGMATILGQRTGMVKIIVGRRYHEILGVHIVGPGATDLIAGAALAIRLDVRPEDIGATLHAHPSLSEAIWEAARDVNGEAIHSLAQR